MAETQILPVGTLATPADVTLDANQTITAEVLFAHFDGTLAAGLFVPTVQIISDSGATVLEVPQDATVAAAASVEASWAPFLKTASAAAAAVVPTLPTAQFSTGTFSTVNGTTNANWTARKTNDSSYYAIDGTDASHANILKAGTYQVMIHLALAGSGSALTGRSLINANLFNSLNAPRGYDAKLGSAVFVPGGAASNIVDQLWSLGTFTTTTSLLPFYLRNSVTMVDVIAGVSVFMAVTRLGDRIV